RWPNAWSAPCASAWAIAEDSQQKGPGADAAGPFLFPDRGSAQVERRNQAGVLLLAGHRGGGGQAQVVLLEHPVGAVAGAHQRAGGDLHEALLQADLAEAVDLLGADPALHRQVVAG